MADLLTKERRSWNMSRIHSSETKPEKIARALLNSMGYRFRLQRRDLPGSPDIVLPKLKSAIFIHGCFWHRHKRCKKCTMPGTNKRFWMEKFKNNVLRDKKNKKDLKKLGWKTIVVWECELEKKREERLKVSLRKKLVAK